MDKELKALYVYMLKHKSIIINQSVEFCEITNKSGCFISIERPHGMFNRWLLLRENK